MKKLLLIAVFLVILSLFSLSAALADTGSTSGRIVSQSVSKGAASQNLGAGDPGILPSNPFYFLKEWGRGIKLFFTPNPVKKANLELQISNEKAAEIKKLEEIDPQNTGAITKAVNNYKSGVLHLKTTLNSVKDTSANPEVDKLLNSVVDGAIKHQKLFDELKNKFNSDKDITDNIDGAKNDINEVVTQVSDKLSNKDEFTQKIKQAIEQDITEGVLNNVSSTEIINKINNISSLATSTGNDILGAYNQFLRESDQEQEIKTHAEASSSEMVTSSARNRETAPRLFWKVNPFKPFKDIIKKVEENDSNLNGGSENNKGEVERSADTENTSGTETQGLLPELPSIETSSTPFSTPVLPVSTSTIPME